jgi:hypothetical protein
MRECRLAAFRATTLQDVRSVSVAHAEILRHGNGGPDRGRPRALSKRSHPSGNTDDGIDGPWLTCPPETIPEAEFVFCRPVMPVTVHVE